MEEDAEVADEVGAADGDFAMGAGSGWVSGMSMAGRGMVCALKPAPGSSELYWGKSWEPAQESVIKY